MIKLASKDDLVALRLALQRQQRELSEKLKAIQLIESMLSGPAVAPMQSTELAATAPEPSQKYKEVKLRDACEDVLATVGTWYSTSKIAQAVITGGFPFTGNTPMASVATTLQRMEAKRVVERKKAGKENHWRLKSQ